MKRILFCLLLSLIWNTASAAPTPTLLLGINEGLAEQAGFSEMQEKYKGLAELLSNVLKKQVKIETSQSLKSSTANLQKGRYDLMFCRPSNVAAKAIQGQKYALVAMAKGNFTAAFIVNKDSPLKKPEDINGKRIAFPAETALMTKAGLATLRDMNITAHIAGKNASYSSIDGRTTRHPGYVVSQRKRKRVEEIFGWLKTVGLMRKTKHRGVGRVGWMFTFATAVYNLVRMRNLAAETG